MVQTAKVTLVKKNPCPFCDRAMNFFDSRGIKVEVIDLTNNLDELMEWKNKTGWSTVPIILINDQLVGGYTDLKALDDDGKLEGLLQS
ncbi:MAG: glutaredoxin domain-containing protein [Pseudobdellovibrio sp.]